LGASPRSEEGEIEAEKGSGKGKKEGVAPLKLSRSETLKTPLEKPEAL
jgi:hypothetical protein